ncbi:serine hydrolase [Alteromonas sp. 345S023]|uniref:Serine hydrolase n=1 Tax=Alteromonas profundi TaxID=2696062 RepID=A0A7X5LL39_9ALTE|nr:serine hydrolase [Alteromonas profundi]NDV91347.1 serine hydrolase [Alteromonas profundi]
MRFRLFFLFLLNSCFTAVMPLADTIYANNFQSASASYSEWTADGNGNDAINLYQGNYSLRHDGLRTLTVKTSTQNYESVSLSADVAGLYLVSGDACYAEYSTDNGGSWQQIASVVNGQDNGALITGTVNAGLDDISALLIRFRAYTLYGNYCYGDNVLLTGAASTNPACDFDCFEGTGNVNRTNLTLSELFDSQPISLLDYSHYGVPIGASNPTNVFEGNLSLTITPGTLIEQGTNLASAYTNPNSLPAFNFSFVQHGTHIIPTERQIVNTGHSAWEWALLPGKVWDEASDNGYSRVALPFALQEINANCTHNGVMTFLFKNDGSVSNVAYQIAQETCTYFKFNLHGKVSASYTPASVNERDTIVANYESEYANRLPVKPLSSLSADFPTSSVLTANIGSDQSSADMTAYGVLYQGTHYRGSCQTRYGDYPFCEVMALPSYSTAKTIVAGLGTMRVEQKYAGSQQNLSVSDWVDECGATQWQDVTLLNALDMATGNYDSAVDSVDEGAQKTLDDFFLVSSHADKINHSCSYPRKASPATQFVYHTSDTYIVSRMLQQYYAHQEGSIRDYYSDLLVEDIFKPLNLNPLIYESKRTYSTQSQVWGGYGLTLTGDDFAKLGRFVGQSDGQLNGQSLLDNTLLREALQQTSAGGLSSGVGSRYQHSVWAYDLSASSQANCTTPTWLPYMSGFGGIGVVMMPNNMVYYYVSDNSEYGFIKTIKELEKISPICGL